MLCVVIMKKTFFGTYFSGELGVTSIFLPQIEIFDSSENGIIFPVK